MIAFHCVTKRTSKALPYNPLHLQKIQDKLLAWPWLPSVIATTSSLFVIPIALYRPQIGPPAQNGKKWPEKWILATPGKGEKMAEKWEDWLGGAFCDEFILQCKGSLSEVSEGPLRDPLRDPKPLRIRCSFPPP